MTQIRITTSKGEYRDRILDPPNPNDFTRIGRFLYEQAEQADGEPYFVAIVALTPEGS